MNSGNGKTFDPHRLLLNLSDKIDLKRSNMLLYEILAYTVNGKRCKKTINLKYPLPSGMKNSHYLKGHILYQIIKTILSILSKTSNIYWQFFYKNIQK